jgi:cullin 1
MEVYTKYYNDKTSHRCLKWVPSLGQNTIKATFKRTYDLQVTTLQAVVLLQFNDLAPEEYIKFPELVERLNVDEDICKRILHSLCCAKHRVLTKEPMSKKIDKTDKFKVNESFSSNLRKVRIPMASLEDSHNPKRVEEDRSIAIEAAVVRIMKARKTMEHALLLSEVMQQLSFFKPDPRFIKRRIEHLIDREYLERDTESPNTYKYLA